MAEWAVSEGATLKSLFYTATILCVSNIIDSFIIIPFIKKYQEYTIMIYK